MKFTPLIHLIVITFCFISCAQKDSSINKSTTTYKAELVVDNISNPWGMAFLPDNSILITEKSGELIQYKDGSKNEITGLPKIYNRGQGGLMDIVLDPNYQKNRWLYISYASSDGPGDGGHTAIMRAKLENQNLTNKEILYKATPNSTQGQHFGSRITFDNQGYMFFTIGERGERDINPQDINRDGGKVYRINSEGSIPSDNPFTNENGAKKAIYSYGHRNPQGMILHPQTSEIWIHEHGPKGGDEINIIKKGANYGWPLVTFGKNYSGTQITSETSREGMEDPIHQWTPSIAPSGMAFVTSSNYTKLKGNLLVGSLKFQYLELLILNGQEVIRREKLLEDIGRVRNVIQAPDGFIYLGIEGKGIYKLIEIESTTPSI